MRGTITGRSAGVRFWYGLWAALVALTASGCGEEASAISGRGPQWPAAAAGGACQLLDYEAVAARIGTRFDTAGAASKDETFTCALTQAGRAYPDLTLAVTATSADEVIFTATVTPSGSTAVKGLGKIAYRVGLGEAALAAAAKTMPDKGSRTPGPGVEIGWLSANGRLMIVRYIFAPGATAAQVAELTPKLVALAKLIDHVGSTS